MRSGAIAGLAEFKTSEAALNLLFEYTKIGVPQPLRLATIRALGKISVGQSPVNLERILEKLAELAKETFFLTQVAVAAALGQMETPKAVGDFAIASRTNSLMGVSVAMLKKKFPRCKRTSVQKKPSVNCVKISTNSNNKTRN